MKTLFKAALLAASPLAFALAVPTVANAQATSIAVADVQGAVQKSAAFAAATAQIRTTYAAQITAYETRGRALQAELKPLADAFDAARRAPNPNQAALQTQLQTLQTRQRAAETELNRMSLPIQRAQAYATEQVASKLDAAIKAAMVARRVNLVVAPQATVSYQPAADITDAIVAELNKTVPTVGITPPANWQPGQQGVAPTPTTPAPTGR